MQVFRLGSEPLPEFKNPVLAIGAFDGLHQGHQYILDRLFASAEELNGDSLLVTFEPHPRLILDQRDDSFFLLSNIEEKIKILSATRLDYLIIVPFSYSFSLMVPEEYVEGFLIKHFKPVKIIAGYDHRFGKNGSGDGSFLRKYAEVFDFEAVPQFKLEGEKVNSSRIRHLISNKKIALANRLLGHLYSIKGEVIPGDRIGRALGYRTANIEVEKSKKLIPPNGIYSALCEIQGTMYEAMLYIGNRKSIGIDKPLSVEVHLLDFNQDIYGHVIEVFILEYIRNDESFSSNDELKNQISIDEKKIRTSILKHKISSNPPVNHNLAIAILNYNGKDLLQKFLPGVIKHKPDNAEIYIIDNGSSDNSIPFLDHNYPDIKIIKLRRNYGFASGYNKGIAQIDADYVAILNSDVQIEMDWITPTIGEMRSDPFILAAQPKIKSYNEPNKFEYAGASGGYMDFLAYPFCRGRIIDHIEEDKGQYDTTEEVFWTSGAAMIVKSVAFKALGGFDADYFAHQEEIDLCWRIKRAGGKVISTGKASVYHVGGGTLDYDNPRKTYLNFKNNLFTLFKNEPYLKLAFILPFRLVLDSLICVSYLLKGKIFVSYKIIQAYVVSIINTLYLIHKKSVNNDLINSLKFAEPSLKGKLGSIIFLQFYFSGNRLFSKIPKQYFK